MIDRIDAAAAMAAPVQIPLEPERLAAISKALGHPVRVRIVAHLRAIEQCVCGQIVDVLPLAQSTVSQHLKILKDAGLVKGAIEGPRTCYCIDHQVLADYKRMIQTL